MNVSAHIIIKGLVQGVGFRYFTSSVARRYGLKGYVKNLYSGDVEIVVEGDRSIIQSFLQEIKVGPRSAHVADLQILWGNAQDEFKDFFIQ